MHGAGDDPPGRHRPDRDGGAWGKTSRSHGRSGRGDEEALNIPNWATSENIVTITFRDFQQ
jgi:hypothetical protein